MLTQNQITLNSTVSFDLWPAQILGTSIKNAKVLALVDAETARSLGEDVVAKHATVYPMLPPGVVNRYDGYMYVRLKLMDGTTKVIGLPWIKEETYVEANTQRLQITIENISDVDQDRIRDALSANGFSSAQYVWMP